MIVQMLDETKCFVKRKMIISVSDEFLLDKA